MGTINEEIIYQAKVLYDYLNLDMAISKADVIIGFGCMDKTIPKKCAELYKEGYGKLLVFSGKVGKGTKGVLNISEAKRFQMIATEEGVSSNSIMLETKATNTYENYRFTRQLLDDNNVLYNSVIVVQKPYVMRRCKAIADKEMTDKKVYVTSCDLDFDSFVKVQEKEETMTFDDIVNELVGEISIILTAPKYGIQSEQIMDDDINAAYQYLIDNGYTKYLVSDENIKKLVKE